MSKPSSLCRRRNCQQIWAISLALPTLAALAACFPKITASSAMSASSSSRQSMLRPRRTVEEEKSKSNDDEHTIIALHPFSLQLSNLPSTSPMLAIGNDIDTLLELITYLGTQAFTESQVYGDWFDEWDVGNVDILPSAASDAVPSLAETEMSRSDTNPSTTTAVLTLGHNGTVTFNGVYLGLTWEDNPDPQELTDFLVQAMNSDVNRKTLLMQLRSLVCIAEDLIANECDVELEVVTISDAAPAIVANMEDDTQDVTTTENEVQEVLDDAQDVTTVEENEVLVEPEPPVDDANGSDAAPAIVANMEDDTQDVTTTENEVQGVLGDAQDVTTVEENEVLVEPEPPVDDANGSDAAPAVVADMEDDTKDVTTTENEVQEVLDDAQDVTTVDENEVLVKPEPPVDDANISEQVTATNPSSDATSPNTAPGDETNDSEATIPSDQVEVADLATDLVGTNTNSLEASSPSLVSAQGINQGGVDSDNNNSLQIIIPVAIGAALVAFLVAGLLYRQRRKQRQKKKKGDGLLGITFDEETPPELMSPDLANNAYDAITKRPEDSSTTATAGASVTATTAAIAAGAPTTRKKARNIEDILEYFSDGDSSFVSDSSVATSNDGRGDVLSDLTGILGGGSSPTPLYDMARTSSHLSVNSTTRLMDGTVKQSDEETVGPSMRKQEDFEGSYRTRSAMAKLNLKKDILHVECETHDAPTTESDGDNIAGGESNGEYNTNIDSKQASGKGYGITRTISPKKSTDMVEKQRIAEKMSLHHLMGKSEKNLKKKDNSNNAEQKKKEEEEERNTSKDLILPVGFKRSDSVDLVSQSSSESSLEDDIMGVV